MTGVRTCLWFDGGGAEAVAFYVGLLPGSRIERIAASPDPGTRWQSIDFVLAGVPYRILDAGPMFPQTEAVSIAVTTPDQPETDRLWAALTADGGREGMCGWLKDRWGLSWQIVPEAFQRLAAGPAAGRVMAALMGMRRIDIATLEAAAA
jgi:predicted 3-demethylubiquinone-9 3-methyltransferase (glyoxalase superfamily)